MALVVFTGGARSGKSAAATELARNRALTGQDVVVVVFGDGSTDEEMARRIERHRADRPAHFATLEMQDAAGWFDLVSDDQLVVVDCMGTLIARLMDETGADAPDADVEARCDEVVSKLVARQGDTILVTNEVGSGVVPAYASGRRFRDLLGRANRRLVSQADAAYLVVCGRLVDLAVAPTVPVWPED